MKRLDFMLLIIVVIVLGAFTIAYRIYTYGPVQERQFNARCQYPPRPLVNGHCDNSDPCDPTTLDEDGLWGDCRDKLNFKSEQPLLPRTGK